MRSACGAAQRHSQVLMEVSLRGTMSHVREAAGKIMIRDRVVGLRRVRASELIPNPKNYRRHPKAQADALRGLLSEVGFADALLARETPAGLMLLDGHLRAETTPDMDVPVLILDLDEAEADKLLLTLDPLSSMAEADKTSVDALLATVHTDSGRGATRADR